MAEESQDDKTEEPTARRLEKAKEDGQVLRSQDMTIAAVTCTVIASLYLGGFWMGPRFVNTFTEALTIPANYAFEENLALNRLPSPLLPRSVQPLHWVASYFLPKLSRQKPAS